MKRMRRCFPVLLAVFLLLCTGAYAEAPPISTAPAQADVDWKGTVWPEVDLTILVTVAPQDSAGAAAADAGAPIPGAVVTAACLPPGGGRTGNDGRLTITGLAANTGQDFAVSAAGYQAGGAQGVLPGQYTGRELVISLVRLAAAPPTAQPSAAPEPGGAEAAARLGRLGGLRRALMFRGFGAAMALSMRLVPNPGDGLVQVLADTFGIGTGLLKDCVDAF